MPGWADRKLKEIAEKQKDEQLRNEKLSREHVQQLAEAPQLWEQLGQTLKQEIDHYNETFPNHLSVTDGSLKDSSSGTVTPSRTLQAPESEVLIVFHANVPQIYYKVRKSRGPSQTKIDARDGRFLFEVRTDGVWLVHKGGGGINDGACNVPSAAGILLDYLVE